jgi:hypothetical protein
MVYYYNKITVEWQSGKVRIFKKLGYGMIEERGYV